MKKPIDILHKLVNDWFWKGREFESTWKPGAAVEKLDTKDREILKQLSSDDASNIRQDVWTPIKTRK